MRGLVTVTYIIGEEDCDVILNNVRLQMNEPDNEHGYDALDFNDEMSDEELVKTALEANNVDEIADMSEATRFIVAAVIEA